MKEDNSHIREKRGNWSSRGVPHKGWECIEMIDLKFEDKFITCEMCKASKIRYVHVMKNKDYSEELKVGCICAGHMEESLKQAKKRETNFKSIENNRANWPNLRRWYRSRNDNLILKKNGSIITIFLNKYSKYSISLKIPEEENPKYYNRSFSNENDAKIASFDFFQDEYNKLF